MMFHKLGFERGCIFDFFWSNRYQSLIILSLNLCRQCRIHHEPHIQRQDWPAWKIPTFMELSICLMAQRLFDCREVNRLVEMRVNREPMYVSAQREPKEPPLVCNYRDQLVSDFFAHCWLRWEHDIFICTSSRFYTPTHTHTYYTHTLYMLWTCMYISSL